MFLIAYELASLRDGATVARWTPKQHLTPKPFDFGAHRPSRRGFRTWGALDFVLTGDVDGIDGPVGFLLTWGTPIGDIDVGYGNPEE